MLSDPTTPSLLVPNLLDKLLQNEFWLPETSLTSKSCKRSQHDRYNAKHYDWRSCQPGLKNQKHCYKNNVLRSLLHYKSTMETVVNSTAQGAITEKFATFGKRFRALPNRSRWIAKNQAELVAKTFSLIFLPSSDIHW